MTHMYVFRRADVELSFQFFDQKSIDIFAWFDILILQNKKCLSRIPVWGGDTDK